MTQFLDKAGLQYYTNIVKQRLNSLENRGQFLSIWNSKTGLAETNPPVSPYEYKAGDFYVVGDCYPQTEVESITIRQTAGASIGSVLVDADTWKEKVEPEGDLTQNFSYEDNSTYDTDISVVEHIEDDPSTLVVEDEELLWTNWMNGESIARAYCVNHGYVFEEITGIQIGFYSESVGNIPAYKVGVAVRYNCTRDGATHNDGTDMYRLNSDSKEEGQKEVLFNRLAIKSGLRASGDMQFNNPWQANDKWLVTISKNTIHEWELDGEPIENNDMSAYGITYTGTPTLGVNLRLDYRTEKKNYRPNGTEYEIGVASTTLETARIDKADVYIYDGEEWLLQQHLQNKVDRVEEPNILYGTGTNGEQIEYKAGENIVLDNYILPEEYTEVEYIKNTSDKVELGADRTITADIELRTPFFMVRKFREADSMLGITTRIFKFVYQGQNGTTRMFAVYAIENGIENLFVSSVSKEELEANFGLYIFQTGTWNFPQYFTVNRTDIAGEQYIDTGVILDDEYRFSREESQEAQNVQVSVEPTFTYINSYKSYNYVDLIAYNDGNNDVWGRKPAGYDYPSEVSGIDYLRDTLGITITGDIHYGTSYSTPDCTVIRIRKDGFQASIKTEVRAERIEENIFPVAALSITGNYGVGLQSSDIGVGYIDWSYDQRRSYIPVSTVWTPIEYSIEPNKSGYFIAGENKKTFSGAYTTYFDRPLFLFATSRETQYGSIVYSNEVALKRTTIIKNNETAFDGVPCIRKVDNVPGMYDLVSETFISSTSDYPFIAGEPIEHDTIRAKQLEVAPSNDAEVIYGFENDEYVQLEWLQSDGTNVIDLGFTPSHGDSYEIKFKIDSTPNSLKYIYGNCASDPSAFPCCSLRVTGSQQNLVSNLAWTAQDTNRGTTKDVANIDFNWHVYKVTSAQVFIDGSAKFMHSSSTTVNEAGMALFGAYVGMGTYSTWTIRPSFQGKIEYFKVYRRDDSYNDVTIHDFIMVRRKSDGVLGAYDKVFGTFHPKVEGNDFVAGAEYGIRIKTELPSNVLKTVASSYMSGNTIDAQSSNLCVLAKPYNTLIGVDTHISASQAGAGSSNTLIGYKAQATGTAGLGSTVVGADAYDSYGVGTVIGSGSGSKANGGVVVGANSLATGTGGVAIGYQTRADGEGSINIGNYQKNVSNSYYSGIRGVAIGYKTQPASNQEAINIGYDSRAGSPQSLAIGVSSQGNGQYCVALGHTAKATASQGIAIGYKAQASTGITIGPQVVGSGNNILIGNVSCNSSDAIVIAPTGTYTTFGGAGSVVLGINANCGTDGVSIGKNATNQNGSYSVVLGSASWSSGSNNVAVGYNAGTINGSTSVTRSGVVALGSTARVIENYGIAIGSLSNVSAERGIAIGESASATQSSAIQIGRGTNGQADTLNVGFLTTGGSNNNWQLLKGIDGTIPYQRLTTATPTDKYVLTYDGGTDSLTWAEGGGGGGGEPYVLPTATKTRLGGVKVGNGLSVKADGTLSVDGAATGGFGASYDGGAAYTSYLTSQIIEGGSADSTYTTSQYIDGGRANM